MYLENTAYFPRIGFSFDIVNWKPQLPGGEERGGGGEGALPGQLGTDDIA